MSVLLIPVKMVVCVLIIMAVTPVTVMVLATKDGLVEKVSDFKFKNFNHYTAFLAIEQT